MSTQQRLNELAKSKQQGVAPTPLVSADSVEADQLPVVQVPGEQVLALETVAEEIAAESPGTKNNHHLGLLGEVALARYLGISIPDAVDTEVYTDGGDGGIDLHFNGETIDVKTAGLRRTDPALTVDADGPLNADKYVLASRIGQRDVRLIGNAPQAVVRSARKEEYDGRSYYCVEQGRLVPFANWRLR